MFATRTSTAVAVVLAGALMAAGSAAAENQPPPGNDRTVVPFSTVAPPTGRVLIQNYKSKKYLMPDLGQGQNGIPIVQWERLSTSAESSQRWNLIPDLPNRSHSFENVHTKKNLSVGDNAYAIAVQREPAGDANQDWGFMRLNNVQYPGGYFSLQNRNSGMCLGIDQARTGNRAVAIQAPCDGKANQMWGFVSVK